jgi:hypothetical protein
MPGLRGWYRIASGLLLVAAGAHLVAHWRFYLDAASFDAPRRAVMAAMQSYVVFPPTGGTLWTVLQMFSLCFAILLAVLGTQGWILARECEPAALRRHAIRNALLCAIGALAVALLHPLPQPLLVLGAACMLHVLAAIARRD